MDNLKDRLIINQQKQIRALQADNHQLNQFNAELKKVLLITLQDNLGGRPAVINRQRLAETEGEFELTENIGGDILVRVRAVYK
jgi:hypothetical protein